MLGIDHLEWLKQYGDFKSGIPVHDTIATSDEYDLG